MLKLLIISAELPFPPNSGGRIKSWNMLKHLSNRFDVGLACPVKYESEYISQMVLNLNLRHFLWESVDIPRSGLTLIKSYLHRIPINVYRTKSDSLKTKISSIIHEYDIVLIDHYESGQYLPSGFAGKVIFHAHNATFLMWDRYSRSSSNLIYRVVAWIESLRVKFSEVQLCQRSDLIFASPNDIRSLVHIGAQASKLRVTYHLGDDSQLSLPSINFINTNKTLLYVGTLSWEANIDGLLWFFESVWPLLIEQMPEIAMKVVGNKPDPRLINAVNQYSNIELTGYVDDIEPLYVSSRLFLAPLRFGSGIKVKVVNAMCRGIPVITTPVGAEGLDVKDMVHLSITDTAEDMAYAILHLLNDETDWVRLERNSRVLVNEKYTWNIVMDYMISQICELSFDQHSSK